MIRSEDIQGWMSDLELTVLRDLAGSASVPPGGYWVEVGVFCGRSAHAVGLELPPNASLALVDPYADKNPLYDADPSPEVQARKHMEDVASRRKDIHIFHYKISSVEAAEKFKRLGIKPDVVFIDGDHEYQSILTDCKAWEGIAKILMGHDYNHPNYPGVTAVVHQLYGDKVFVYPGTSIWRVGHPWG